MKSYMPLGFSY